MTTLDDDEKASGSDGETTGEIRNGVPLLPRSPSARPVTLEMVNRLRDEEDPNSAASET